MHVCVMSNLNCDLTRIVFLSLHSFCNLSAKFAVTIKGIEVPRDLRDIAAANYAILTGILLALVATYVWFHRSLMKKEPGILELPNDAT